MRGMMSPPNQAACRRALVVAALVASAALGCTPAPDTSTSVPERNEILWDTYGVPHVYLRESRE